MQEPRLLTFSSWHWMYTTVTTVTTVATVATVDYRMIQAQWNHIVSYIQHVRVFFCGQNTCTQCDSAPKNGAICKGDFRNAPLSRVFMICWESKISIYRNSIDILGIYKVYKVYKIYKTENLIHSDSILLYFSADSWFPSQVVNPFSQVTRSLRESFSSRRLRGFAMLG